MTAKMNNPRGQDFTKLSQKIYNLKIQIEEFESSITMLKVEISRREENRGYVEDVKQQLADTEATVRTLKLLKSATEVELNKGQNAAGEFLGDNILDSPSK